MLDGPQTLDSPQTKARIQIDTDLGRDALLATGIIGQEAISRPYVYDLTLLSRDFGITPEQLLRTKVTIRVRKEEEGEYRALSGFVVGFAGGELHARQHEYRTYTMRVAPWLTFLDHGVACRIFQNKDVLQIIDSVLRDAITGMFGGASPDLYYSLRVQSSDKYPTLEYCVQYNETDFNFISRLMEKHGIHYFFKQTDTNHKMIIVEGPPYPAAEESPISLHRSKNSRGTVRRWTHSYQPQMRRWVNRDRDYRLNPAIIQRWEETMIQEVSTQCEHFEFPGGFAVLAKPGAESDYADNLALIRIQEEETRFDVFSGNSIRVSFSAGTRIRIIRAPEQAEEERISVEEEKDYLITSVTFSATEVGYTDDKSGEIVAKLISDVAIAGALRGLDRFDDAQKNNTPGAGNVLNSLPAMPNVMAAFGAGFMGPWLGLLLDWASPFLSDIPVLSALARKVPKPPPYTNSFCCVPIVGGRQYHAPSVSTKPRVPGPQTAMVYGPADEDVWTDELGRVLVKFDWDRSTKAELNGETTSCWLRVVQGWAGPKWGMQFLPRVGEEVLVDFIGGDPDRPIILGRVYNAVHKPPFELKKYRLQSGIKTRSVPLGEKDKDRFHMLRFDDTHGSEQVLVRSQRRLDIRAFGSTYETTSGNRNAIIGWKDPDSDKQGGDFDITIGNDYQVHVNGGRYERVEKPRNLTVVGQSVSDLEADDALMVKGTANINAAQIILEASQKISLKVGGNAVVIDPTGVTIIGTMVKINSGGAGEETGNPSIEDPADAAASDTGEPGWLEKHKGGPGGGRKRRQLSSQHYIAPPRPGEPAEVTAIRNLLNQTPTGRNAMYVYDRNKIQPVIGAPGVGMSYNPSDGQGGGNTVVVDPASPTPGSSFVHEMNHADTHNNGTAPNRDTMSRDDYVNGMLAEEAQSDSLAEQTHNELAAAGTPEAEERNRFTGPVYDAAQQQGENDYRAAHPDASQSDVDEAGRKAGEQAALNSYKSGNVLTGGGSTPQTYQQYYGDDWDGAHPTPPSAR
jgi:type VI secretion system VgrG family protein